MQTVSFRIFDYDQPRPIIGVTTLRIGKVAAMSDLAKNTSIRSKAWQQDRRHCLHPYQHFASFDDEGSLVVVNVCDKETKTFFPLTMTRDDVDFVVATLSTAIELTMDDLREKGLWSG